MKTAKLFIVLSIILLMIFATGLTDAKSGEEVNWQVISSGGARGSSTSYVLNGTVGQTAIGAGSSTNYAVSHGYWQDLGSDPTYCNIRGDVDHAGSLDVADLTYLVAYLFTGGPSPPCYVEGDVDASGGLDVADLTYLVAYLFTGGPQPPPCP